ncbi:uncharacterized protein LOC116165990 [Photinus pyralis]|uniref:uncharacterized protein LOC116165990 n=1 Tax=Photinus pyralis TaxID=7054 RepID=UPI00126771F9|nr:uncharacterized protein LOC116165990 [Photinus pyralis]
MQRVDENKLKIFTILQELGMENTFPTYLSDLLAYNGYASYETLSLLVENDITKLEEFARQILPRLLLNEEKVEDRDDIDEERGIFEEPEDLGDLNIQDFSAKYNKSNQTLPRNMLKIKVNGKEVVVKKSTLCWLFSIKTNRLSSDRLLRFRGSTASSSLNKKKQTKSTSTKRKKKRIAISEAETDEESDRYSEKSELENESFGEEDATDDTTPINTKIDISAENYYAVCYLRSWYIGRVLEIFNDDTCQIKFLKCVLDSYVWPKDKDEDIQIVENKFIFYGPISLLGNEPFILQRHQKIQIEKEFKISQKLLKDFL